MQLSGLRDEVMAEQSAYFEACEECGEAPDPDTVEYFDAHIHSLNAAVRLHDAHMMDLRWMPPYSTSQRPGRRLAVPCQQ